LVDASLKGSRRHHYVGFLCGAGGLIVSRCQNEKREERRRKRRKGRKRKRKEGRRKRISS